MSGVPDPNDYLRGLTAWGIWCILALGPALLLSALGYPDFHEAYGMGLLLMFACWFAITKARKR